MAMKDDDRSLDLDRLNDNLAKFDELSQRLLHVIAARNPANATLNGPSHELFAKAINSYWAEMIENPGKIYEHQLAYWGKSVREFLDAQKVMLKGEVEPDSPADDLLKGDKRFSNPLWQTHPFFRYVKRQYALNALAIKQAVQDVEGLSAKEKRRLEYFSQQIIDLMAPTNFLGTNPDALERAVATEGESLVRGMENLIADLEANNGELIVRLVDEGAFDLGKNIATSPGEVVYRNRMMELIQYAPSTKQVYEIPLVIFPPWINKFYIMDLRPENSLIRWVTEQGYTLFVVSWVNPDETFTDVGLEEYINDGYLAAFREIKAITGQKRLNVVGYCIAGTALALTLSLLKKRGDKSVKSATFFTTLTDFADQGEFTPFLQDDFIDGIETEVAQHGVLRSFIMARTFSFLRSRDLVFQPAVRSYMMGEAPPAFDLLYWNGDGANLPGKMLIEYLRGLCQENRFAEGGFDLMGERLHLRDVDVPLLAVSCLTDHIAAWKDCYRGVQAMQSKDRTFIVSESGHVAGIVNPPSIDKYGHYTNADLRLKAADWLASAAHRDGSWWPTWESWLRKFSGKKIDARQPGDTDHPSLAPAPGTYVLRKVGGSLEHPVPE